MNEDAVEGEDRRGAGGTTEFVGRAAGNDRIEVASAADASPAADFETLRSDVARLTQTVSLLVQSQTSNARETLVNAATATQDKLASIEAELESRIQRNPIAAMAIGVGLGMLFGKMSRSARR